VTCSPIKHKPYRKKCSIERCRYCTTCILYYALAFCVLATFGRVSQVPFHIKQTLYYTDKTPWPESASVLNRPSDRRSLSKLVPAFTDRGCHVISMTDPTAVFSAY
jgi:hypothetical protein